MAPSNSQHLKIQKIRRNDGSSFNLIELRISKSEHLTFHQITSEERQIKLLDIGQWRLWKARSRGVENSVVIVWDAFSKDEKARDIFILDEKEEEISHISLNSFIIFNLRYIIDNKNYIIENKKIRVKEILTARDQTAQNIIELLEKEARIQIYFENENISMDYIYNNLDSRKDCIAVGNIGFLSSYARKNQYPVVFNTSYFLLEEEDYLSEFSLLGDPYSMIMSNGIIEIPPLYNRYSLLLNSQNKWEMKQVSLNQISMNCFGRKFDLSKFSYNKESDHSIYTRYFGVDDTGRTINCTPHNEHSIDFLIVGRRVVGMKYYGQTPIPQNGFIFSIPIKDFESLEKNNFAVNYKFADGSLYKEGIQCGPGIIKDGKIILNRNSLIGEEFRRKRICSDGSFDSGVVPTDYADDIDESRNPRIMLCIDSEDNYGLLAFEGVNKGMELDKNESSGVTLIEMAKIAKERNYKFALNLDGGGSANIQYYYGNLVRFADRRGRPGVIYERMVPCAGVIV